MSFICLFSFKFNLKLLKCPQIEHISDVPTSGIDVIDYTDGCKGPE